MIKSKITAALALALAFFVMAACGKFKDTTSEAKGNVKTLSGDVADKATDVVKSVQGNYVTVAVTSPRGATMKVYKGKAWNAELEKRQDTYRVPFSMKLKTDSITFFEISDKKGLKVYAKIETRPSSDFTEMGGILKLSPPENILEIVNRGQIKSTVLKDPQSGTPLVKVTLGKNAPN